jgi:glycosyltransferase involved in cell wall biosynthesis
MPKESLWGKIHSLPPLDMYQKQSSALLVSFLIPAFHCSETLEHTVLSIRDYLQRQFPDAFEILIIPNGIQVDGGRTFKVAEDLARRFPEVKIIMHKVPLGKGAALRTGFSQSIGEWLFFTDADLPYDLSFFSAAARLLADGVDFVSGNRRSPQSHFTIPVTLLHLAYRRHRVGLIFNRMVRLLFPMHTSDTQAGIKAMSRRMAEAAFSRQTCPGFLFDLELFLCCVGFNFRNAEIPVRFFLRTEKSTVQLFQESVLAGIWLAKIFWRYKRRWYTAMEKLCPPAERETPKAFSTKEDPSYEPAVDKC